MKSKKIKERKSRCCNAEIQYGGGGYDGEDIVPVEEWCKKCHNEITEKVKSKNPTKYKEAARKRRNKHKVHLYRLIRRWILKNNKKMKLYYNEYQKAYQKGVGKKATQARRKITYLVGKGKIKKHPCKKCGTLIVEAHHYKGYDYPLEIQWLCKKHHLKAHNKVLRTQKKSL